MTASITALPTGFAAEVDGAAALVVGYLHAFPRHPQRGALVQPLRGAQTSVSGTGVVGAALYALVSVDWATEVTTIEPGGRTRTVFATGWLGTPQGTTWVPAPGRTLRGPGPVRARPWGVVRRERARRRGACAGA